LIDAEYIVTVELDVYFLRQLTESLFQGDYYGAPWSWEPNSPGGGGLSIRKVQTMIEICEQESTNVDDSPQDCWIASNIIKYNYIYPSLEFRKGIFLENAIYSTTAPYGVHQFWTFMNEFQDDNYSIFILKIKSLVTLIGLEDTTTL